jgi:hypothetical protein
MTNNQEVQPKRLVEIGDARTGFEINTLDGKYLVTIYIFGRKSESMLAPTKEVRQALLDFAAALAAYPYSNIDEEDVVSVAAAFNNNL